MREEKPPPPRHPAPARRRSALRPATPRADLIPPTPAKQSAGSISLVAHSSSVVAPSRDGKAGMLFSRADLRISRTGPLSVGASDGHPGLGSMHVRRGSFAGGNQNGCSSVGTLPRQSPTFASLRAEEAHKRAWCFAGPSCSSPPRLAALGSTPRTATARRKTAGGRLETTASRPVGASVCAAGVSRGSSVGATVDESGCSGTGSKTPAAETARSEEAQRRAHGFERMPPLKKMASEERDVSTRDGTEEAGKGEILKRGDGCAEGGARSRVKAQRTKAGSQKSLGGAHTGMSVTEFADKVAALAADVASVLGISGKRPSTSQESRMTGRAPGVGL